MEKFSDEWIDAGMATLEDIANLRDCAEIAEAEVERLKKAAKGVVFALRVMLGRPMAHSVYEGKCKAHCSGCEAEKALAEWRRLEGE